MFVCSLPAAFGRVITHPGLLQQPLFKAALLVADCCTEDSFTYVVRLLSKTGDILNSSLFHLRRIFARSLLRLIRHDLSLWFWNAYFFYPFPPLLFDRFFSYLLTRCVSVGSRIYARSCDSWDPPGSLDPCIFDTDFKLSYWMAKVKFHWPMGSRYH